MWSAIATSAGGGQSACRPPAALVRNSVWPPRRLKVSIADAHRARVAALVIVAAALEQRDALALELADHQPAAVAGDAGHGKAGDFGVGDRRPRSSASSASAAEARAEHEAERRQRGDAAIGERDDGGGGLRSRRLPSCRHGSTSFRCSGPNECGSNSAEREARAHAAGPGDMDAASPRRRIRGCAGGSRRTACTGPRRRRRRGFRRCAARPASAIAAIAPASAQAPCG